MRMSRKEEKKKKTREGLHKCFASHRIKKTRKGLHECFASHRIAFIKYITHTITNIVSYIVVHM
jgi:hypothetical protein